MLLHHQPIRQAFHLPQIFSDGGFILPLADLIVARPDIEGEQNQHGADAEGQCEFGRADDFAEFFFDDQFEHACLFFEVSGFGESSG
ncbi:MAG: hypothetical protein ALAOOOJD_03287 [bacterium]|nr:hypothetical protein [bacterium]